MEIAKALITVGPASETPPWPVASVGLRQLFPVANRPILVHALQALRVAGILEATILAPDRSLEDIMSTVAHGAGDLIVRYAGWERDHGIEGALAAGRDFLAGEPVLVQEGGALLRERMHHHISTFAREGLDTLALRLPAPVAGARHLATSGYLLSPKAVSIILDERAAGGPVDGVRAHGGRVRVQAVDGCLPCHGNAEALLETNRLMLQAIHASVAEESLRDCKIQGPVEIHPTARLERTLVRGPAVIGPGTRIREAYVGPYSSIGAGVILEGSEVEHSIILDEAQIRYVGARLESSVIGVGARVTRRFEMPGGVRMSLGAGAEVTLR
jgi:glucose-1-phosphate thymidylyltransferase